jgi:hypothetical protein
MLASLRLHEALGRRLSGDEVLIHFSASLDESDTHDSSIYTVIGGAVATTDQWDALEAKWQRLMDVSKVGQFHYKDFEARQRAFAGWKSFACERFLKKARKIIDENVCFRTAVAIDPKVHLAVKNRMKGIKGFHADSDYGLCLRWLLFQSCESLIKKFGEDFTISVIVEDGPYASGAVDLFRRLRAMTGKNGAKHASKYRDIDVRGKASPSLQVADAIVGIEADHFGDHSGPRNRLSVRLDEKKLESWYTEMIDLKEKKKAYAAARRASFEKFSNVS